MLTGTLDGFKKWMLMSEAERKELIRLYEEQEKIKKSRQIIVNGTDW